MMQRAATSILPTASNMLVNQQQQRGMATLKTISMRLKSVKNIQKITQSMKMVSAAKYSRAERELKQVRPYGLGSKQFYEKAEVAEAVPEKSGETKRVFLHMSSDRGE
jgi:F-type H+-transporting ATPase subunit gamma